MDAIRGGVGGLRRPTAVRSLAVAAIAVVAAAVEPAHGATATTRNACLYSVDDVYRDQAVVLTGSGSPIGAQPGSTATLSGASLSARLPSWLPQTGYELGIFKAGRNAIPSQVWIALAAANAQPATQVRALTVTASTTIRTTASGAFRSGTPIVVTIPIPTTRWTVAAPGPVTFSQAGPGTLPPLPIGVGDRLVPVAGSIVVKPKLATLRFVLDCQPGSTAASRRTFTPAIAAPFAGLEAAAPVPRSALRLRVASTVLRRRGGRVGVAIACPPGAVACAGRASVRSLTPVRVGGARRVVTLAVPRAYRVPAGTRRTVRLRLGALGTRILRTRRSLPARVTLEPSAGPATTRMVTLTR